MWSLSIIPLQIKKLAKSVEAKEKARDAVRQALENNVNELSSEDEGEEIELRKKQFGKAPYVSLYDAHFNDTILTYAQAPRSSARGCFTR